MMAKTLKTAVLLALFFVITGFDLDNAIVPRNEILSGGPPKDGIPAILDPKFVTPAEVDFLRDSDAVIGVEVGGAARAYPIRILNWHEVVNDTVGGQSIAVTF
jgi:hypothetical protein